MTTKAKLDQWVISGIEFEAKSAYDGDYTGTLPDGIVRDPNDSDLFFFSPASFAASELQQLVDDGYLDFCYPQSIALVKSGECFCVRLALNERRKFYGVYPTPEPADCELCKRTFPFINDGQNVYESAPARGPSYSSGGEPAEWDVACTECLEREPDEDYDPCEEEDW
jgi:hypothetical protein